MDKTSLSERDICTKFITPALRQAGWDEMLPNMDEVRLEKEIFSLLFVLRALIKGAS